MILLDRSQQKERLLYQEWQKEKLFDRLENRTRSKQKLLAKSREIEELKNSIAIEQKTKKSIDITYSNQRQQAAKMPEKVIALTFDDGPSHNTHKILNILNKYQAKATFFVTGLTVKYGCDILKRIYNEGHEINCQSYLRPFLSSR